MEIYAPDYYLKFKCIANKCRHSCCIGWDVYVDDETLQKYALEDSELGMRIQSSLTKLEDGIGFKMCPDGRCPFLDSTGLCDIITQRGDDLLCEICREHPRFYNFFSDHIETGIGLSCEEASRIIICAKDPAKLVCVSTTDEEVYELLEIEKYILENRAIIFDLLQKRNISLDERIESILTLYGISQIDQNAESLYNILKPLERLDPAWENSLLALRDLSLSFPLAHLEVAFENILRYFLYRHLPSSEDEGDFRARIAFSVFSLMVIRCLCYAQFNVHGQCDLQDLCEIARGYSAEIEYSEDNTLYLIEIFK